MAGTSRADSINGHSYVALASWARANGFVGYTLNGGSQFVLTNRNTRMMFNQDSEDSNINGVNVRLSFPVAKGGFISQLDADKTVRPLIFKQKPATKKITTICIDPGHGGRDVGYEVGHFLPHYEKTYTLALALELRRQLQRSGFNVVLTRDKDIYQERPVRTDIANRHGADLFISLHFNSFPPDPASVQGPETYCITPVGAASSNDSEGEGINHGPCPANRLEDRSLLLAYQIQRALVRNLGATDRSVRRARWEVLRTAEMPAILIEGGYMSHPTEGRKIFDAKYRQQMAAALVKGVLAYQAATAPSAASPASVTNRPAVKTTPAKKSS